MRFRLIGGHVLLKRVFRIFFTICMRRVNILFILSNLSQAHIITLQDVPLCKNALVYMWIKKCVCFVWLFTFFFGLVIDCSKKYKVWLNIYDMHCIYVNVMRCKYIVWQLLTSWFRCYYKNWNDSEVQAACADFFLTFLTIIATSVSQLYYNKWRYAFHGWCTFHCNNICIRTCLTIMLVYGVCYVYM